MARTELAKLRVPVEECFAIVAASGTRTAGTPVVLNDILVYPIETTASAAGVVCYDIPKVVVAKPTDEAWATGQKVYWDNTNSEFTTDSSGLVGPVGIVTELAVTAGATGEIHFIGCQVPSTTLDTNPSL